MYQIPLATSSNAIPEVGFWSSVFIYHDVPHVINRKLAGISQIAIFETDFVGELQEVFTVSGISYEVRKLKDLSKDYLTGSFIRSFLEPYDKNVALKEITLEELKGATSGRFISLRTLLPRSKSCSKSVEIVIFDKDKNQIAFYAVSGIECGHTLAPSFPYVIELTNSGPLRLCVDKFEDADTGSAEWLSYNLFQKLIKWSESAAVPNSFVPSLFLIVVDDYVTLYHKLKAKYAEKIIKIWPESTDPQKFVFEDVAIASYLICLWNQLHGNKKPSFVDVGCGNGLLVYILTEEGYPGFGVDVRGRKIWKLYPKNVRLDAETLTPTSTAFPESEWIIGNHSDELTLWIPVIALRSSPKTNFFLLPCCPYDFNGRKYQRLNSSQSQYAEFMNRAKDVASKCGFAVKTDRLRIPSTKRNCLIGYERNYAESDYDLIKKKVAAFIESNLNERDLISRPVKEPVRNCTQLNKDLVSKIVLKCVELLLEKEDFLVKSDGSKWNKGGVLELSSLPRHIPLDYLKQLKSECGGLQTLLKNHRYLFFVRNGSFRLREPLPMNDVNCKYSDKVCWFHKNHPNGCLYDEYSCACKHL